MRLFYGKQRLFPLLLCLVFFLAPVGLFPAKAEEESLLSRLTALAGQGNHKQQFVLGFMYSNGLFVPKNETEGFKWMQEAASSNWSPALFFLGLMHEKGQGTPRDLPRAFECYRKAADDHYAPAMIFLATMYIHGMGVEPDFKAAAGWLSAAAPDESPAARDFCVGLMYAFGHGVSVNTAKAMECFKQASQASPAVPFYVGLLHALGNRTPQDATEAVRYYRISAEKDFALAQFFLAFAYERGFGVAKNKEEAERWFAKGLSLTSAAAIGDPSATLLKASSSPANPATEQRP